MLNEPAIHGFTYEKNNDEPLRSDRRFKCHMFMKSKGTAPSHVHYGTDWCFYLRPGLQAPLQDGLGTPLIDVRSSVHDLSTGKEEKETDKETESISTARSIAVATHLRVTAKLQRAVGFEALVVRGGSLIGVGWIRLDALCKITSSALSMPVRGAFAVVSGDVQATCEPLLVPLGASFGLPWLASP